MTENIYNLIIEEMQPLISEKSFKEKDGVFSNEEYAFKIEHNEEQKLLKLFCAPKEEGEIKEFVEASAFLFEDAENIRDAKSAGLDFLDTAKIKFGVKSSRYQGANITLPKSNKSKNPDIEALTAKILNIYPEFKEDYKEHVSKYNSFLYIDFYKTFICPKLKEVVDSGNKKQISKIMSMLSEMYNEGDRTVGDVVVGVILTGAMDFDNKRAEKIVEYLNEYNYLKVAAKNYFNLAFKDKNIKKMLDK